MSKKRDQKENRGTFKEYYESLPKARVLAPKQEFLREIAKITGRVEGTVKRWLAGEVQPSQESKNLISKHLGISTTQLFHDEETS